MGRITLYCRTTSASGKTNLRFRISDGRDVTIYYSTGRKIPTEQLAVFAPDGKLRPRVTIYNPKLKADIDEYFAAINSAYNHMKINGMDLTSATLQQEVDKILNPESTEAILHPTGEETLIQRFYRYVEEAYRDNIIGKHRHMHYEAMVRRMDRFLHIKGHSQMMPEQFDVKMLMDYRQFIADEYQYVKQYPKLYQKDGRKRYPTKPISNNSVVHEMKAVRAFFNELENTDEIFKSPFRKISHERFKAMMRMKIDEPYFLRSSEFKAIVATEVPPELQMAKDMFVLNCCIGARIGDFLNFSMDKVAVSDEGIPFIHYIPHKTSKNMENVVEIKTPLIRIAYDIVMRTRFNFLRPDGAPYSIAIYNRELRKLLELCHIDRQVPKYNEQKEENEYFPLYEVASSRLARKTHIDIMNKVQVNIYVAGLHAEGSDAVHRYTNMELADRFSLMNVAFGQRAFHVNPDLTPVKRGRPKGTQERMMEEEEVQKPGKTSRRIGFGPSETFEESRMNPTMNMDSTSISRTIQTPDSSNNFMAPSLDGMTKRRPGRPKKVRMDGVQKRKPGRPKKEKPTVDEPHRKPGRPKKVVVSVPVVDEQPRRKPGRPKKTAVPVVEDAPKKKPGRPKRVKTKETTPPIPIAAPEPMMADHANLTENTPEQAIKAEVTTPPKRKPGRPKRVKVEETPSIPATATEPKKRGRSKRTENTPEPTTEVEVTALPKRKPGRPRKVKDEAVQMATVLPKRRGRSRKSGTTPDQVTETGKAETQTPEKRRRGRPKKTTE